MLAEALKRFSPFRELDAAGLAAAAAHARLIELPARRWLLRHGRGLNRHLYLVEGEVQAVDEQGRRRKVAGAIYRPGDAVALETQTAARLLSVDLPALQSLLDPASLPEPEVAPAEGWLSRLLASPLVRALPAITWQRLLRGAKERRLAAGERLQAQDAVYVVKSGALERGDERFGAGEFFGEDIAFAGERVAFAPSAYVARCAARLLVLPGATVRELLVDYPLAAPSDAQVVNLNRIALADLPAAAQRLNVGRPVAVRGGRAGQRAYALITLTRLGFAAAPAADAR